MKLRIEINGTNENPYHRMWMGLTQNPFPQIAQHEFAAGCLQLQSLGGDPIKGPDDIRQRLKGFTSEFVEKIVARYVPGQLVKFEVDVTWPNQ